MKTKTKRYAIDRYLEIHPDAAASVAARATGCHVATVYLARKRLGIPTTISDRKRILLQSDREKMISNAFNAAPAVETQPIVSEAPKVIPTKKAEKPRKKHPMELHHEEMAKLNGKYNVVVAAFYGLSAIVVASIVGLVLSK